jgi:glycerol-3-phosphate dehydrogenase (NAD(P)+)
LAVLGAGSWGTALAIALAPRFESIRIWTRNSQRALEINQSGENRAYLPGCLLPQQIEVSAESRHIVEDASIVLIVVPSQYLRDVLPQFEGLVPPSACLVSATKGLESPALLRMSEVISGAFPHHDLAVLSGPTFAQEIAAGEPAAVVIASEQLATAECIQRAFATSSLRLYTSTDVVGTELGAALKNVIAIGAGVCNGLGLGSNAVAALITRGLAEITRLALAMGAQPRTLSGLAGLGDLVLTCTGELSRNRFVGMQLGHGKKLPNILAGMNMVAEGVATCAAAYSLGVEKAVDLPIVNKMYEVLYAGKDPRQAIRELMDRPLTSE